MKIRHTILSLLALALCIAHCALNSTSAHAQNPEPTLTFTDYSLFVDGSPRLKGSGRWGAESFGSGCRSKGSS